MFFFQLVRGLTPTQSALMLVPMAVISAGLARPVGKLIDRGDPRRIATFGLLLVAAGMLLYFVLLQPGTHLWLLLIPSAVLGVANACMWGPLSAITTFNLPMDLAGAGSGVYNTSRQVGAVLGSASITALMASRLSAEIGTGDFSGGGAGQLPEPLREGFALAMGQSLLLPVAVIALGAALTLLFAPRPPRTGPVRVMESPAKSA